MVAALQEQLLATEGKSFLDLLLVLLNGRDIAFTVAGPAEEVAELTVCNTNIRGVGVAVNDPGHHIVGDVVLAQAVADVHQFRRRGIFEQKNAFFRREGFEGKGTLQQLVSTHKVVPVDGSDGWTAGNMAQANTY